MNDEWLGRQGLSMLEEQFKLNSPLLVQYNNK